MNALKSSLAAALFLLSASGARADLPGEGFKHHLVISLGIGLGTLSPGAYDAYVDIFNQGEGAPLQGSPAHPSFELHVPIIATYYFPDYILLRTGVEAAYFFPGESFSSGSLPSESVTDFGGILEVPIFVGGHYAFLDNRLIAEVALGPAIAAFTSAGLNSSGSYSGTQYYANPAVGFDDEIKAQYFLTPGFSVGLELGYRVLTSGNLHSSSGNPLSSASNQPVQLDMSGFRAVLEAGFTVF